jgi:hypothetical protein
VAEDPVGVIHAFIEKTARRAKMRSRWRWETSRNRPLNPKDHKVTLATLEKGGHRRGASTSA